MWHYQPKFWLRNGLVQTIYIALQAQKNWQETIDYDEPDYQEHIFQGADNVPIFALVAIPNNAKGTIVGTYGITGTLENQWFLRILGRKAYAQGYAVILFDWRAHGKTALLSPHLTSDGLYEGQDYIHIASQAKEIGCPAQFWFTGYSLGGKLALWGLYEASRLDKYPELNLEENDIGGGCAICPSLDASRSLNYLENDRLGKYLEKAITRALKQLAEEIHQAHPDFISRKQIDRANSIQEFDRYLVIPQLGFATVEEYYRVSSPLTIMSKITKPTLILYAIDDPMFAPSLVNDLTNISEENKAIDLVLTKYGGHVGYISSHKCQEKFDDPDRWWAWNRFLQWVVQKHTENLKHHME